MQDRQFVFAVFRLDPVSQQLWRGDQLVPLRPKLFAVLRCLLENPGRLITRDELHAAAWPATRVSESVLRGTIRDLRDVLGDDAADARFVETVPHRGYRFVAPVVRTPPAEAGIAGGQAAPAHAAPEMSGALIGREAELARLRQCLDRAARGVRQVLFVTGEPGIGKTTLVDAFLAATAASHAVRTVRGQCVERYGAGEAYLPVLEALGQLCRQADGAQVIAVLSRYAPTWVAQMPGVAADAELEAAQRRAHGATRERMLRELAEAVEALTVDMPLVLVLEDLHWSDYSTLDLVSSLAQRRSPARLLLLGTYRPAEVAATAHPLKGLRQELLAHAQCEELALRSLSEAEIGAYLRVRFPGRQLPAELAPAIHRGTEGNPLFVVNVVDYWLGRDVLVESDGGWRLNPPATEGAVVPDNLRQMIDRQLDRLAPPECRLLETASVAGREFSTAVVATALEESAEGVEELCESLARREQFVRACAADVLADGTVAGRYAFRHALYQQVLYERVAAARRARLHRSIGAAEERALGARGPEHAAQLAMHFERGQDAPRAMTYLMRAAENAMRRQAPREAAGLLGRGLTVLGDVPASPERDQQELALLVTRGVPLLMTEGYAAKPVEDTYERARALCRQQCESPQLLPALAGLFRFHIVRADFSTARGLGEQVLRLAQQTADPMIAIVAHSLLGVLFLSLGEPGEALDHLRRGIALYDPRQHGFMAQLYGDDPGVTCHSFAAMCVWFMGYPDQALAHVQQALDLTRQTDSPYGQTFALDFATWVHVLRRDRQAARACVDRLAPIAMEHQFQFLLADSKVLGGWVLAAEGRGAEGVAELEAGIAAYESTGAAMSRPAHLSLLARACASAGRLDEGLTALARALTLVEQTGERTYAAELYRLKGELTLAASAPSGRRRVAPAAAADAEAGFQHAIEIARRQQARSLELRAAISLSRLWLGQGKRAAAVELLRPAYAWFSEGFDSADLIEARTLLAELA